MPTTAFDVESIKQSIVGKLQRNNRDTVQEATPQQLYKAVASTVRDQIMQKWMVSRRLRDAKRKRLYYLSVEFLTGRSLNCNLINLCSQERPSCRRSPNPRWATAVWAAWPPAFWIACPA